MQGAAKREAGKVARAKGEEKRIAERFFLGVSAERVSPFAEMPSTATITSRKRSLSLEQSPWLRLKYKEAIFRVFFPRLLAFSRQSVGGPRQD